MPQQSWIHARVSPVFFGCAALLAATEPQNISNRDGLKQAWLHAMYAIQPESSARFTAQNAAQNLKLSFGSSQTRMVHGDAALALRLVGYGRRGKLQKPGAAVMSSAQNRVEYRRGGLTEWYVNQASGLEQGFTLSAPPTTAGGPLEIALDITGNLHPEFRSSRDVSLVDSNGRAVLRYDGLRAWDARGKQLAATFLVSSHKVRLVVEDAGALYPVTIDPTVTQIVLTPSDGSSSVHFGQSLSISANTALVGAPSEGGDTGAAYVFVFSGGVWSQQAKLTASDGVSGDQFGSSVSVDGATAVIGASGANSAQGEAYVFMQSGSTWTLQAKITASDGAAGDQFGVSIAVSGASAVVGASGSASGQGAAYVFAAAGSAWSQQAKLTAADAAAGDLFGASVSLSGTTAVAGAAGKFVGTGAAYVFINSSTSWSQQAKLTAADGASGDLFGFSVSISGDTVLAGAPIKTCQFSCGTARAGGLGGAYVFIRTGTSWSQQAALVSSDGGGAFGYSVAVSGTTAIVLENYNNSFLTGAAFAFVRSGTNWPQQAKLAASDLVVGDGLASAAVSGSAALVGAPGKTGGLGAVYAFLQTGTNWTQQAKLIASGATSADGFGSAISVNGETALIASPLKASQQGAVYVFVRSATDGIWSQQAKLTGPGGAASFGQSVSLSGDTAVIGASNAAYIFLRSGTSWTQQSKLAGADTATGDSFGSSVTVYGDTAAVGAPGKNATGAAYVFVRSGATWAQQAKLTASDAVTNDSFGNSISLSGDTVLMGARGKNSLQGAAYVFVRSGITWTQQAELTPPDGVNDNFGQSVSLSGGTAIVGAYFENSAEGAVYVFVQSGTNWAQQAKLQPSDGIAGIIFGTSVSIDGDLAVISAYKGGGGPGAAYVFARSGANWTQSLKLTAANGITGDEFGNAVSISEGTVITGAPGRFGGEGAAFVFPLPTVSSGGLVNAASFSHTVAPGSIASVFGTNYANSDVGASVKPLPDNLGNVSITVNNVAAPLIFVGQFQANFQIPFETQPGIAIVVVTSNGIVSQAGTVNVTAESPGIFITGTNQAVALNPDNSVADSGHPAKVGTVVVMYVTGLGALDHPLQTGSPASSSPLSNATVVPTATVGGVNAVVQFAGMSPGFVGLGQINLMIPKLAKGTYPVVITQSGQTSNNPVLSVTP